MFQTNLKPETIAVLRNCDLLRGGQYTETCGADAGKTTFFVRCIPFVYGGSYEVQKAITPDLRRDIAKRVVEDLKANGFGDGVALSNNPDFGGDYVRVERRSRAHNLICHMKS